MMMVNMIGDLKGLRKDRGLSSKELAQQVGVATSAIWGYESGAKKMSQEHAERLGQFFGVSPETLLRH